MKPEDKNAVLQFMGQVYGESKKNDGMLVGQSTNLQPNSDKVKHVFEQTLQTPTRQEPQGNQPVPHAVPAVVQAPSDAPVHQEAPAYQQTPAIVTPEQAARDLAAAKQQPIAPPVSDEPVAAVVESDPNQLEFDLSEPSDFDKLLSLVKEQNIMLTSIMRNVELILKKDSVKSSTSKHVKNKK